MSTEPIFIYGGGGHGKVVIETLERHFGAKRIGGVFDDDPQKAGSAFFGYTIIGTIKDYKGQISNLILAIGNNETRKNKAAEVERLITSFISAVDPSCHISRTAKIGTGTLLMPEVIINADTYIGDHCILNTNAVIEHDCRVGSYTHIAPGAVLTGAVKIGGTTMIGANAVIVPGIEIGNNCLIAAGSVVTANIPDNAVVRGNPARILKIRK